MKTVKNLGPVFLTGSHLQGAIVADVSDLVAVFGNPFKSFDNDADEWALAFDIDGQKIVATVYPAAVGARGHHMLPGQYHVGGYDKRAVELVWTFLEGVR